MTTATNTRRTIPTMGDIPLPPRPGPTMAGIPLPARRRVIGVSRMQADWHTLRAALDELIAQGHPELSWDRIMGPVAWSLDAEEDYWNTFTTRLAEDPDLGIEYDRILHDRHGLPYEDITPMTARETREYLDTRRIPDSYAATRIPDAIAEQAGPGVLPAPDPAAPAPTGTGMGPGPTL